LHGSAAPIWGTGNLAVEAYRREFGPRRDYFNLPYYSDLRRFEHASRSGRVRRGQTTFLYSGSLNRRKGVDLLARAFCRLAAELPEVRLRLVGDGPLRPQLERDLGGLGGRVEFAGFRDWDALPAEYAQGDVLCVPSRHDGWGLVVPEGMAAGLPVISTEATGAAVDLIDPSENGWRVSPGDADALHRAMREAASLTDEELTRRSAAAIRRVESHSLERGAEHFLRCADEALKSRNWES
jgi:glycosyltransferase involved in cell wall biosynthesis